jgi:tetratricopeptide (TPR) repeat protein
MNHKLSSIAICLCVSIGSIAPSLADDTSDRCYSLGAYYNSNADSKAIEPAIRACNVLLTRAENKSPPKRLAGVFSNRAVWKTRKSDLDGALADYNEAAKLDPNNFEIYDYRADVWKLKGDLTRALEEYDHATRIDPSYAAAYYSRGEIYEGRGEIDKAISEYKAALATPSRDRIAVWAHERAQAALDRLGQKN